MSDIELRTALIERNAPTITFKRFGFAAPTKTERLIFRQNLSRITNRSHWAMGMNFWDYVDQRLKEMSHD